VCTLPKHYPGDKIIKNTKIRRAYRVLVGKPEGRRHLENPGVDGKIILKWIFEK
jgi:hypothetical protein